MGDANRRQSQHRQRKIDGENSGKPSRKQTRIGADTAADLDHDPCPRVATSKPTLEGIQDDGGPLWRGPRMPLARKRVEELPDFLAQRGSPPAGIEAGCTAGRYTHRMIGPARARRLMPFDGYRLQVLNSHDEGHAPRVTIR